MKITEVRLGTISVPLRVPFKTALRTVNSVEDVIVELRTDTGAVGYGEAPPTGAITGEALVSAERLGKLGRHIQKNLEDICRELARGDISADPYWRGPEKNA